MKIRSGFVSNSSSSSFVILGVLSGEILDENMDHIYLDDNGDCVTGIMIARGDEEDFGANIISFKDLKEKAQMIQEKLGVSAEDIKIYSGVQYN
jgi:hypothetical protein